LEKKTAPQRRGYSAFNTLTGSAAVAVRAGAKHAAPDTIISTAATLSNVAGSLGSTP